MTKKIRMMNLTVIMILLLPLVGIGLQSNLPVFTVWIVNSDGQDIDTNLALRIIQRETAESSMEVKETSIERLDLVPFRVDVLILVGHGSPNGLETSEGISPWSEVYGAVELRKPRITVVLACNSPSDPLIRV
jgi:hypothetical protein